MRMGTTNALYSTNKNTSTTHALHLRDSLGMTLHSMKLLGDRAAKLSRGALVLITISCRVDRLSSTLPVETAEPCRLTSSGEDSLAVLVLSASSPLMDAMEVYYEDDLTNQALQIQKCFQTVHNEWKPPSRCHTIIE